MSHQQPQPNRRPGDVFPASRDPVARAEREDLLDRHDIPSDHLSVAETKLPGKRIVTASAGGQILSQFEMPDPAADVPGGDYVSIGEALEAAAAAASDKPVGRSDAAAVQAAETRATAQGQDMRGGVAAAAQAAAEQNAREDDKVRIRDVLDDATEKLPKDKVVTREDAERVRAAEEKNSNDDDDGVVADAVEAASRINSGIA